jgi:hypothetical protein
MYQAIATRFLGPTNNRGARIKARAAAGSVTLAWDHRLGVEGNHRAAAVALAEKFGWPTDLVGGSLPGNGYAFVARPETATTFHPYA